VHTGRGKEIYR
jgi:hypothetical protein